jgi:WXG100 family type VII secretion target
MGLTTQADLASLATAANEINNTYATLNAIQTRVRAMVQDEVAAAFRGGAGSAFQYVYANYDKALEDLYRALDQLGQLIREAGYDYQRADDDAHAEINLVDIPTGPIARGLL